MFHFMFHFMMQLGWKFHCSLLNIKWSFIIFSLLSIHIFWLYVCMWISCNTMLEAEEALWTASWAAWKFPIENSWSGIIFSIYIYIDIDISPFNSRFSGIIDIFFLYSDVCWMVFVSDDNARRCKSYDRNCWCIENRGSCNESYAKSNVSKQLKLNFILFPF